VPVKITGVRTPVGKGRDATSDGERHGRFVKRGTARRDRDKRTTTKYGRKKERRELKEGRVRAKTEDAGAGGV